MRMLKMLALVFIGTHLSTSTQEEPIVSAEPIVQEQPAEQTKTVSKPEADAMPKSTVENTAAPTPVAETPTEHAAIEPEAAQQETTETKTTEPTDTTEPVEAAEPHAIEIPAIPEPTVDEESTINQEITPQSPVGIDTVSLEEPQGNWLFKKIWWERAEERYEKIRLLVDAIWNSRTEFFRKHRELNRDILDSFYVNVGITQGDLQTMINDIIEQFEKQREEEGDLNEEEREEYEKIATEQESLKQLKMDVDSIAYLDHELDKALETLMKQINDARALEDQAWKNFKEIAHILNDSKARELYYMIEGAARNIKNISTYIERDFLTHFDMLIDKTKEHIEHVNESIQALKEKGITFKSQAEQAMLQREQEKQQAEEEATEQEEEENQPKPKTGWINWIISGITKSFNFIFSIIRLPYDMIFGGRQ